MFLLHNLAESHQLKAMFANRNQDMLSLDTCELSDTKLFLCFPQ